MVRLKQYRICNLRQGRERFQFHYGSIKIQMAMLLPLWVLEFQFHYGSIKILQHCEPMSLMNCFNSTMVRLKCNLRGSKASLSRQFQFHYGSIKIQKQLKMFLENVSFNSTMVRLKYCRRQPPMTQHPVSIPLWFD